MANISPVKQSDSVHSIDMSKPNGISSFWNLFSKNNKKQNISKSDKPKVNKVIMKVLKSKGIDLENLENFDMNNNQTSKQKNRIVIINPHQENFSKEDLVKRNILFNLLQNKNNLKGINNFKESFTPQSKDSVKAEKGLISFSMTFLKSKRTKDNDVKEKKGFKMNETDNTTVNIPSSTISQQVLFKAVPKEKLKNSKRKRVMVPVYVGNNKSNKSTMLKKENVSDDSAQGEIFHGPSLGSKIKTEERKLNEFQCKTKKSKDSSWKTSLQINHLSPNLNKQSEDFQLKTTTIKSNEAEGKQNSILTKPSKKAKINRTELDKHHGNIVLCNNFLSHDVTKSGKDNKQNLVNLNDTVYNRDVLIKNHKLIIPSDITDDSLFQANPYAGCDTFLKLFKALSQENGYCNQPKNMLTKKNKDGYKESRKTSGCVLENTNNVETALTHGSERNKKKYYVTTTNKSSIPGIKGNSSKTSSTMNGNGLRNIFSLPINLNILKTSELRRSEEKSSESEKFTKSPSDIIEEKPVSVNLYKKETPFHVEHVSSQCKTSKEKLTENLEGLSKSVECFPIIIKSNTSKSRESGLNNIKIIDKKNTSSHQLQNSSTASKEELADDSRYKISVGTLCGKNKGSINRLHLNISHVGCETSGTVKPSQKLFKKTTISCPIETLEQKVSITILIENNPEEGKKIVCNPNVETPYFTQMREIQHFKSSLELEKLNSGKEEHVSQKDHEVTEELSCVNGSLTNESICKQNCVKTMTFGLPSNKSYLTQKERKIFDEEVLGVDYYEKSINLSNLKFRPTKREKLLDITYRPGLVNILSESSVTNQEVDSSDKCKLNILGNRKILHRFGKCFTRNPFYMERFSNVKKQTIRNFTKEDSYFRNYKKNTNIPQKCFSINPIELPSHADKESEFIGTGNEEIFKTQIKNYFVNTECGENSNSVDVKRKSCRCNLTVNQKPLVMQTENSFLFSKNNRGDQIGEHQPVDIEQNYINNKFHCLNSMTSTANNDGLEMFRTCDTNCPPKNNQGKMFMHRNFNTVNNSQISFYSYDSKLNTVFDKINSTTAVRSVEDSTLLASDKKIINLEMPLSNFQYKKVHNEVSICSSNNVNELIQDKSTNFQYEKIINSEVLLGAHASKNPEIFYKKPNFNSLVQNEPQLFFYKTVKNPSSQQVLNDTIEEKLQNGKKGDGVSQNNNIIPCNCCNTGCLTVVSEEDLTAGS